MCNQCYRPSRVLIGELEDLIGGGPGPVATTAVSLVDPTKVSCQSYDRSYPIFKAINTKDPVAALEKIARRACEMLDKTIAELKRVKSAVEARDPAHVNDPIAPLTSNIFLRSLAQRMQIRVNNPSVWTAKAPKPGTVAILILWLTNIRNLIASRDLWYVCLDDSAACADPSWAWVFNHQNAGNVAAHRNFFRIHLCRHFWNPGRTRKTNQPVSAPVQFEYQAQTIIHEVSHIYYNTSDDPGVGPGVAECVSTFVAETNGSPLDDNFEDRCGGPLK